MSIEFDRAGGVGGSDVPAILNVSPYATRTDVWMEKVRHPAWRPKPVSPEMRFGTLLEPVLRAAYEEDTGRRVNAPGMKTYWAEDGVRYAHLDGLVEGEGIWEGKVPFQTWRNWKEGPPPYVHAQVQHYLDITGEPWADVTALSAGLDPIFRTWRLDADPVAQADIRTAVLRFWEQHVLTGQPPDALPIEVRYPTHESDLMIVADDEAEALAAAIMEARIESARDEVHIEELKAKLKERIGPAAGMIGTGWRVRYKKNRDGEKTDWKLVAGAYRELLDEINRRVLEADDDSAFQDGILDILTAYQPDVLTGLYTTLTPGARPFVLEEWNPKEER